MFTEISGYTILKHIASGGFGEIYVARHQIANRMVAIKVTEIPSSEYEAFIERFIFEAELITRLEHPNIITLYDYWYDSDATYLIMDYIADNLAASLYNSPLGIGNAARLLNQIARALDIAHRNHIVHQDIKPENILLDTNGNAYLTDFGIARDIKSDVNLAHDLNDRMHGSPTYISPERLQHEEITQRSDIYSLGILMYEVLTGLPPFMSPDITTVLRHHIYSPLPKLQDVKPHLPDELNVPLQIATMKNPKLRYDKALDFAHDFQKVVAKLQIHSILRENSQASV